MKLITTMTLIAISSFISSSCFANANYNAENDNTLKNMSAVESANVNLQYQCGQFSLFISAFATSSELNGKNASVAGKITSDQNSHDISKLLSLAISRHDVLTGQISVSCNAKAGAFRLEITPNEYAAKDAGHMTTVSIFADGTVEGSRSI